MINIELDPKHVKKARKSLQDVPRGINKVTKNAINKTIPVVGKELHNDLKNDYNIKISEVKKGLTQTKATISRLSGSVIANGPVTRLKTGFRTDTSTPKAYAAYIKKKSRKSLPEHAFVATMPKSKPNQKNQHTGIFVRTGKERLNIRELTGPSVAGMANSKNISKKVKKVMVKRYNDNFDKEVVKLLRK